MRERYGRTQFGQGCLLARRLAEVGVPMVSVHYCLTPVGSWDTHSNHFRQMKQSLCPTFDQAFAALVADLHERGLLGQTLVLANAAFAADDLAVDVQNASEPTLCAEKDNIYLQLISPEVRRFTV